MLIGMFWLGNLYSRFCRPWSFSVPPHSLASLIFITVTCSQTLFDVLLCFGFLTLSIYSSLLSQCAFDFFASFGSMMQLLTLPSILLGTLQWRQLKELTEQSIKGPCSNLNRGLWFAIGPLIYPRVRKLYFPYSKANRHLQQTPSNFCRS